MSLLTNKNKLSSVKTSFWQKIALVIFSLFLLLVLLELGLRLAGSIFLSLQEYRNRVSISKKGSYRIMCLGESTTQRQYPPFLEEILNQRNIGINFSVIDKAIGGRSTSVILEQLEPNLDEYRPDMVVTMMGINDSGPHMAYKADSNSAITRFLSHFRTYSLTRLVWLRILTKAREIGFYKSNPKITHTKGIRFFSGEDSVKEAIETPPQSYAECIDLAWLYCYQAKFSQAEEMFKKAISLTSQSDKAYVELGRFYNYQYNFAPAEEMYRKAIELNPQNDTAYIYLGLLLYHGLGKFPQAEESLKKAIELKPDNEPAYTELGYIYYREGKFFQAEEAYKKAIELDPHSNKAYIELGWLYREQGNLSLAEEAYKKVIALNPRNDGAYALLSIIYQEMNKPELAKEYDKKAKALRLEYYSCLTVNNYLKLKTILDKRGIKFVCVQYPVRSIELLKKVFQGNEEGIVFVDNEKIFKDAVRKAGYKEYFSDAFGYDFGHCTPKGNRLLAENIANAISREVFGK